MNFSIDVYRINLSISQYLNILHVEKEEDFNEIIQFFKNIAAGQKIQIP